MYYVYVTSGPSLLIESTDSMIHICLLHKESIEVHVHERQTLSIYPIMIAMHARVIMQVHAARLAPPTSRDEHTTRTRTQTESDRRSSDWNAVELKLNYLKR